MAKQSGIIKLEGTIDDITFVKTKDGYRAKKKTAVSPAAIATSPTFQRTRENMAEFTEASKAGRLLRQALRTLLQHAKDPRVISRLGKEMREVILSDTKNARGLRKVKDGNAALLQGFECNSNAKLPATLFAAYTTSIDRASGVMKVTLPMMVPKEAIVAPAGTTHYKIVCGAAEVDFENDVFVTDLEETPLQPWDTATAPTTILSPAVTAGSAHPLFLAIGIQFYQEVNGTAYALKNGASNALSLVQVSAK